MKHQNDVNLTAHHTLQEHTKEFITLFETAETKMTQWRQEITQQANTQQEQLNDFKAELDRMQNVISEAGLQCFRTMAEETISQSDDYLHGLKDIEQQLLRQIHDHRAELTRITQHAMTRITQKTSQASNVLDEKLSHQDAIQFNQLAHRSFEKRKPTTPCPMKPTNNSTSKDRTWQPVSLTLVTTLVTVLVFGLYTNDEYPWEMHQQATSERGAGKVLINAWPSLTHHEKNKILNRAS